MLAELPGTPGAWGWGAAELAQPPARRPL